MLSVDSSDLLEIEPLEVFRELNSIKPNIFLLDVRQPEEFSRVSIKGSVLVPMMELPSRLEEIRDKLDQAKQTVVICRSGQRSFMVTEWLQGIGYNQARNLRGGINAYAREADPSLEPY